MPSRQSSRTFLSNSKNFLHGAASQVSHAISSKFSRREHANSYRPNSDRYDLPQYDNYQFNFEMSAPRPESPKYTRQGQFSRGNGPDLLTRDGNQRVFDSNNFPQINNPTPRFSDPICYLKSMPRSDYFKPGNIVSGHHYEEAFPNADPSTSNSYFYSPKRNLICAKVRSFVIISTHAQHYTCLAVYTHNGKGTRNKPDREEYVSLQDHRADEQVEPQSSHKPLETDEMTGSLIRPLSAVHISYPISRSFKIETRITGRLRPESTERLIRLYRGEQLDKPSTQSTTTTTTQSSKADASKKALMPEPGQSAELALRLKEHPVPWDESEEGRNVKQKTNSILVIHPGMAIKDAFQSLRYKKFQRVFLDMSWEDAAKLDATALRNKGIWCVEQRENLVKLFSDVAKASLEGEEGEVWEVEFDESL